MRRPKGIRTATIILTITGASVFSGASAQTANGSDLSAIIRTVAEEISDTVVRNDVPANRQSDMFDSSAGNILDNIISGDFSVKENNGRGRQGNGKSASRKASSASVLDFMAKAYLNHDYYQSGKWDEAQDYTSIAVPLTLPPYDPTDFYRPVWGRITSRYGYRKSFGRMHRGIDLALNIGDTVRAALPGIVTRVGYDPGGYGHFVVVAHDNGMETRYAHLQRSVSKPGDSLNAGSPLGLGGNTGNSTGPHLHFEIRYRGAAVDPATVFDFSRLPLAWKRDSRDRHKATARKKK